MLFIGWFGPRGIASILYVLIIIGKLGTIEGHEKIYGVIINHYSFCSTNKLQ